MTAPEVVGAFQYFEGRQVVVPFSGRPQMPTTYNLRASNNATFRWTRDLTPLAAVYNIASATIRMQARSSPYAPDPPAYQWLSAASAASQILFDPTTNLCVFVAPEADLARMRGDFVYDCRLEFAGGASVVIFGGRLSFSTGVTRLSSEFAGTGVSGLGDTVDVEGERDASPVPLPLSLSAAVAACQSSQTLAAASEASAAAWAANTTTALAAAIKSLDLGSAAQQPLSAFDPAGAAAVAQSNAQAAASSALASATAPTALASALAGLSSAQLAALATALVAAVPPSALSAAIGAMIQTLPTAPTAGVITLWSNGGIPVVSQG